MKKLILIIILSLLITGCGKEEKSVSLEYKVSDEYYQVYMPYKKGVSENYIVNNINNKYDLNEVETSLMHISNEYFPITNSYYQAGQYLKKIELIDLLSTEFLNKADKLTVDEFTIEPKYISYLHEQNYVAKNGNLKGIVIGIILNRYQSYNDNDTLKYVEVTEKEILEFGKKKANELLEYLQTKDSLKDKDIVFALYLQASPNSMVSGNYRYVGTVSKNELKFKELNNQYYLLTDDKLREIDITSYNAFNSVNKNIREIMPNITLIGKGLYQNNELQSINLDVNTVYLTKNELIMLGQLVGNSVFETFNKDIGIKININVNNQIQALVVKEKGSIQSKIYILN